MYNIFKFLVLCSSVFVVFFGFNLNASAAQKSFDYRMPFRAGEIWKNDMDHGVHTDKTGYAMDLYPTKGSTWEIIAPADGALTRGCTVNDVTYLALATPLGDIFRFVHLDANSVSIKQGESKNVVRGETLGRISTAKIAEDGKCFLSSELPHTHFSFLASMCPLQIDGYTFRCDDMKDCGGANIYSVKCNQIYLGQEFNSTNSPINKSAAVLDDNYCDSLKNSNFKSGDSNPLIVGLQKCLKKAGLFDWAGGFTGLFGKYTESKFSEWKKMNAPLVAQATPTAPVINTCDNLKTVGFKVGDSGPQITELQKCLKSAGLYDWTDGFTGYFGKYTEGKFNEWKGVKNNIVTPPTSTPVAANSKPSTPEECKSLPYQNWFMTQKGAEVTKLQICMTSLGYYKHPSGATGYFGKVTRAAYDSWINDINSGKI